MVNSAEVDGVPGHANHHLLTDVLRGEMQFKGLVVSDWEDIKRLQTRDRVAATPKEAVCLAVMAGIDMSMVPLDYSFYDLLLSCARDGSVPMARIDEAVGRILRLKFQMGLFANPYPDPSLKSRFAGPEFTAANLKASEETIILARNDGAVLPLPKSAKILVTGPTADMLSVMNGGWTITWQGDAEELYPKDKLTVLKALQAAIGKDHVTYLPGASFDKPLDVAAAVSAAKDADAVVLCLGEKAYCETPGNIDDLSLEPAQLELAAALAGAGKPVVLVMLEGRPRLISSIADRMKGILLGFRPGLEGGRAIANILFGDAVPSAKLPVTYPRAPNALVCYDCKPLDIADVNSYNPQWPFGYGLSYTKFSCSGLKLDRPAMTRNDTLHVSVNVKNTGSRPGAEIVHLYLNDNYGSVSRPVKQLRGFRKIMLQPGEERTVRFTLDADALSFIGLENRRIVEPGTFTVMVGAMSADFTLE